MAKRPLRRLSFAKYFKGASASCTHRIGCNIFFWRSFFFLPLKIVLKAHLVFCNFPYWENKKKKKGVVNYYSAANIMIEKSTCTLRTSILLVYFFSNFVFTLKKDARLAAATREKTSTLPCIQILSKKTAVNTTQPQYCPLSFLDFKCIAPPPLIWISGLFPDLVFFFTTDTVTTKFSKTSHFWFFFFP